MTQPPVPAPPQPPQSPQPPASQPPADPPVDQVEGNLDDNAGEGTSYTRPRSEVNLDARLKNGNQSALKIGGAKNPGDQDHLNTDDGYLGVSPEYQNAANPTDEPGVGGDAEEAVLGSIEKSYASGTSSKPAATVQEQAARTPNPAQVPSR